MEHPLTTIKKLAKSLPKRDIKIAEKYIIDREFNKLLEIVDSDIYLVQRNKDLNIPKEQYVNINEEELLELRGAIIEYMSYQYVPDNNEEDWI